MLEGLNLPPCSFINAGAACQVGLLQSSQQGAGNSVASLSAGKDLKRFTANGLRVWAEGRSAPMGK